jgi:hypothetical protein
MIREIKFAIPVPVFFAWKGFSVSDSIFSVKGRLSLWLYPQAARCCACAPPCWPLPCLTPHWASWPAGSRSTGCAPPAGPARPTTAPQAAESVTAAAAAAPPPRQCVRKAISWCWLWQQKRWAVMAEPPYGEILTLNDQRCQWESFGNCRGERKQRWQRHIAVRFGVNHEH